MGVECKGHMCIWEHAAVSGSLDIWADNNANNQTGSAGAVTEQKVALAKETSEETEKKLFYKGFWKLFKFSKANCKTF